MQKGFPLLGSIDAWEGYGSSQQGHGNRSDKNGMIYVGVASRRQYAFGFGLLEQRHHEGTMDRPDLLDHISSTLADLGYLIDEKTTKVWLIKTDTDKAFNHQAQSIAYRQVGLLIHCLPSLQRT